ncbi:cation channel sperm-associated auxiliary subunit gamma isoform X4 [Cavia porcellus]|uniref:cation channel sperm-associated auxiliary subunit gamma isoform X4 n=1 Tax=Cavia porcellus TaxID=10141 RepID=UPI002FE1F553
MEGKAQDSGEERARGEDAVSYEKGRGEEKSSRKDGKARDEEKSRAEERPREEERLWGEERPRGEKRWRGEERPRWERSRGEDRPRGEERWQAEERPPGEETSRGEETLGGERSKGKERPRGMERSRSEERPRGEERSWDKERLQGERSRGEERPRGEERLRDKERLQGERSRGEERPRGEERSWDQERLQGERSRGEERPRGEERSRDKERLQGERSRSEERPRGEERSWDKERLQGERSRGEERPRGEERSRDKERLQGERSRGEERPRGEERSWDQERLQGERSRGEERPRGEERSWDQERLQGERSRGEERPRGEERSWDQERLQGERSLGEERPRGERLRGKKRPRGQKGSWRDVRSLGEDKVFQETGRGSSCIVRCPAMFPTGFVWPRVRVLRVFLALLAVLPASSSEWKAGDFQDCTWQVVLNRFDRVGNISVSDRFYDQELVDTVDSVFSMLVDSPIDPQEKYLGFPYYLKISYSCEGQPSSQAPCSLLWQKALSTLLLLFHTCEGPFCSSCHCPGPRDRVAVGPGSHHKEIPVGHLPSAFRGPGPKWPPGGAEAPGVGHLPVLCELPPLEDRAAADQDGGGPLPLPRFHVNINGFLKKQQNTIEFTLGSELFDLAPQYFLNASSRPLWYTLDQSPVLILGGIPNEKAILLTDTNFETFSLVELSIDSCWVGSFYCPQADFSATIYDAISTESTLFIRQNQLVYYFTGTYATLYNRSHSSGSWVRVLTTECIKRLCPVLFHSNGSEYIMALTTGKHEGYLHFGTITEGRVSFKMLPKGRSVCELISGDYKVLLLVEIQGHAKSFCVVSYSLVTNDAKVLYIIPDFIPDAQGMEFLMMVGTEKYTSSPMVPKGMFFNTYNNLLFIWGNFLLQSYNEENYTYLAGFPKELCIKYLVNSFGGDIVIITETEEIWYLLEGNYRVYRLFPSHGWSIHSSLQMLQQSSLYAANETSVTFFYEDRELYQLVYLQGHRQGRLVKRLVPVEKLLLYEQQSHYRLDRQGPTHVRSAIGLDHHTFWRARASTARSHLLSTRACSTTCSGCTPSTTRLEPKLGLSGARLSGPCRPIAPSILGSPQPYADPVHDPTWRWWKNKKQDQDYYLYLKRNWLSAGGVHIDMASYEKIYNLKSKYQLPAYIFLDKGNSYQFSLKMRSKEGSAFQVQRKLAVGFVLADPHCIEAFAKQETTVIRNSVQFLITLRDKKFCYDQGISGHHLMKTSVMVKVQGSSGHCFQSTHLGLHMQGNLMLPVFIGCPPGKRLAFDITYTLEYNRLLNKQYFDCVHPDPEMPCFLFRDQFHPFFLIQDLVTGDSGSFKGRYVLKVVGGGPTLDSLRDYSEEEIYRFNSPLDRTNSRIWTTKTIETTKDDAFHIMSPESFGIEWLCLENSPCYDTIPQSIFSPEFYFKVLVSNRGVDHSTYCDYQLIFLLHIHGLPLGFRRALYIAMVSASVFVGLVFLYITFCLLWPLMVKAWNTLLWKMNTVITSESYYYSTSLSSSSQISGDVTPKLSLKEDDGARAEAEEEVLI